MANKIGVKPKLEKDMDSKQLKNPPYRPMHHFPIEGLAISKKSNDPFISVIIGPPKIGKTLTVAGLDNVFFINLDPDGLRSVTTSGHETPPSFDPIPKSWVQVKSCVKKILSAEQMPFKHLVIDHLGTLQEYLMRHVAGLMGKESMSETDARKSYPKASEEWIRFLNDLEDIRQKQRLSIHLLGHTKVTMFQNPVGEDYNRFDPDLADRFWEPLKKLASAILFMRAVNSVKDSKAKNDISRVIETNWSPAWEAGNRFNWPEQLPLDSKELNELFKTATASGLDDITIPI